MSNTPPATHHNPHPLTVQSADEASYAEATSFVQVFMAEHSTAQASLHPSIPPCLQP